jgi:hypothetical protein
VVASSLQQPDRLSRPAKQAIIIIIFFIR